MESVAFHILNNHVGRHVMVILQDDNVQIHQAQIVKVWLGGSMKNHFLIFTHELAPLSPDLKFMVSLWDVLE